MLRSADVLRFEAPRVEDSRIWSFTHIYPHRGVPEQGPILGPLTPNNPENTKHLGSCGLGFQKINGRDKHIYPAQSNLLRNALTIEDSRGDMLVDACLSMARYYPKHQIQTPRPLAIFRCSAQEVGSNPVFALTGAEALSNNDF